jgi:SAM-dependent methyltransferase
VLDVATGSGYGCGLLAARFGDEHVTSIDVDPYLTEAAARRLDQIGRHPKVVTGDATGPLPGTYDRIVAMVGMPTIPGGWMGALRPGGRLVTVIADTSLIITATKRDDGWAYGQVEWDRAMFMSTRSGPDYEPSPALAAIAGQVGQAEQAADEVTRGRYPVVDLQEAWDLRSALEVTAPGIAHGYGENADGTRTALMAHPDGSWARAVASGSGLPTVYQAGPRRLWDLLDELRDEWLSHGYFQLFGAKAYVPPEGGKIHLARGNWQAVIG